MNEREAKRQRTLGPLEAPIQSEAAIEFSGSGFAPKTSLTASDWIGVFKGPNMCTQRFSRASPLRLTGKILGVRVGNGQHGTE